LKVSPESQYLKSHPKTNIGNLTPKANIGNLIPKSQYWEFHPNSQYWKSHPQKPIFEISPKNGKFSPSFFKGKPLINKESLLLIRIQGLGLFALPCKAASRDFAPPTNKLGEMIHPNLFVKTFTFIL
jgi:hypothetical protein